MSFCNQCGNLLDSIIGDPIITCNHCNHTYSIEISEIKVSSKSQAGTFESSLRSKRDLVQNSAAVKEEAATIKEKCPKCQAPEMSFHTMQLRSADEGQTVFYNCVKCGYKYSINS
ncbi:SpRPA12 [Neoconidiobolus thromboides FSU 785]|nr:SpRPA12 [Neoconidiobolus thromboides FSU 785]